MRNIPVDFLSEDSLTNQSLLSGYKAIVITEPNIPVASLTGVLSWVETIPNVTLLLSPFAGQFDEYNSANGMLLKTTGVTHKLQDTNSYGQRWIIHADAACYNEANSWWCGLSNGTSTTAPRQTFSAWGVWGALEGAVAPRNEIVGSYDNKDVAIISTAVGHNKPSGGGRILQFGFWPGTSWYYSNVSTGPGAESKPAKTPWAPSEEMADMLLGLLPAEARHGPVRVTGIPMVETPLLVTPDRTGAVVTLLNWQRSDGACESPCKQVVKEVTVTVEVPFIVGSVQRVVQGVLSPVKFEEVGAGGMHVRFRVGLQYAGMVVLGATTRRTNDLTATAGLKSDDGDAPHLRSVAFENERPAFHYTLRCPGPPGTQVRRTPSWPRSWANFSLF
jgi:hypothetical protein